ncbi:MAG: hypothetical protein ACLP9L_35555 [Thermoguttaceae bacterium]
MQRKQVVATALAAALLNVGFLAGAALGGQKWNAEHPRRAEVNHRLHNQSARIKEGLKTGKLSSQQAQALHQQDHQIRQEERADAAQNGGHITKSEQKQLNQQENALSTQIFDEKHPGAQ